VIRVLIADDHTPTRSGVRAALEGHGFEVCAEAEDADGALEAARRERPDVCLLSIRMPGGGIAAAARIHTEMPKVAIVMLTVSTSDEDLFDSLQAGAVGYLLKSTDMAGVAELTSREWDVMERLADGATTAEIAARLSVSPVTVRRHVSALVRKLGVSSREEAVRLLEDRSGK
jgi:DNA-binding NarL/FixJ family response regulator